MDKDFDILKVITHADGGEEYSKNATKYPYLLPGGMLP